MRLGTSMPGLAMEPLAWPAGAGGKREQSGLERIISGSNQVFRYI